MATRRIVSRSIDRPGWPETFDVTGLIRPGTRRSIKFHVDDRVTILTGPNGVGKTRLLILLRAALAQDWPGLAAEPFQHFSLRFRSGTELFVERSDDEEGVILTVEVRARHQDGSPEVLKFTSDPVANLILPDYIMKTDDDLWEDVRDGELLNLDELYERFLPRGRPGPSAGTWDFRETSPQVIARIRDAIGRVPSPTLVETKRLEVQSRRRPQRRRAFAPTRQERIYEYIGQIQFQVQRARAEYNRISQQADSQFASRALGKSKEPPPSAPELRRRFSSLAELHRQLLTTGLVAETPGVEMHSGSLTAPERRMFAVFLDDWSRKLRPLLPVHEKLQLLQDIVGAKLHDKDLTLDDSARLRVVTVDGTEVPVDHLSSGEQHLLALFAMLLFSAAKGSVVLVDEPEISLHATWKHAFLDDIRKVAEDTDLQFLLATHSTAIINGQWELVEQLSHL